MNFVRPTLLTFSQFSVYLLSQGWASDATAPVGWVQGAAKWATKWIF